MNHLDLDEQETEILLSALESYLSDLRYEIADTDRLEFREQLKTRRTVLEKISTALKAST